MTVTDEMINHMVNRFLNWKLPENFNPDGGISFQRDYNQNTPWPAKHEPSGTNLLDAKQAEVMVRHMLDGLPALAAAEPSQPVDRRTLAERDADSAADNAKAIRAILDGPTPSPADRGAVEALKAMLETYGPPASVADACVYPSDHAITKARNALAAALALPAAEVGMPEARRILKELRDEDDTDAPVHSERKAGWHAALDAFEAELSALAAPSQAREE